MTIIDGKRAYLADMGQEEMEQLALSLGEPRFRGRQLFHWVHSRLETDFTRMSDLPRALVARLDQDYTVIPLTLTTELVSADGMTRKALLRLADGQRMETVLMEAPWTSHEVDRYTVCVSSQVGCALACSFCVTGQVGFGRQLSPGEIAGQVYYFERRLRELAGGGDAGRRQVTNVVFMGMGEPFANYGSVMRAIRMMTSPDGLGLGARRITVSTAGVVPGIEKMSEEGLQLGLAISLHAPTDEVRDRIMPINRRYPIAELMKAAIGYATRTGRRVTYEYAMMDGVNDSLVQARRLAELLEGQTCHVNLIPLNQSLDPTLKAASHARTASFQQALDDAGIPCTIRQTKGQDILAACGQLRYTEEAKQSRRR